MSAGGKLAKQALDVRSMGLDMLGPSNSAAASGKADIEQRDREKAHCSQQCVIEASCLGAHDEQWKRDVRTRARCHQEGFGVDVLGELLDSSNEAALSSPEGVID